MADFLRGLHRASQWLAWTALILLLPVTSLPWLAQLANANTVAAASSVPLVWLTLVWLLPYIFRHGTLPRLTLPFLGFVVAVLITMARAHFLYIPPFKGRTILTEEIDALLTLIVGVCFYLVISGWPRTNRRLQITLILLNLSGATLIAWSMVQSYHIWFQSGPFPGWVVRLQEQISTRDLIPDRATGFAFEPSWLAHQFNLVFLPYWLAATINRYSAHRLRLFGLSLENLLLAGGILTLFLSLSRVGILAFLLAATYVALLGLWRLVRLVTARVASRLPSRPYLRRVLVVGSTLALLLAFLSLYAGATIGLVYGVSRYDSRLAALFNPASLEIANPFSMTNQLAFAERVVYWATGWEIFNDYPFLGVGLGNAGFFFPDKMPAFGWELYETNQIFFHLSFIPNTKSMWTRLLAETGLLGFALFLAWLYVAWRAARLVRSSSRHLLLRTSALAGELALIAFLVEGFSIDSFALPYLWVAIGLLTATTDQYQLGVMTEPDPAATADPPA